MSSSWICPTCTKSFARKGDLTRHKFLHIGYRPHVCSDCGKSFAQFSGLKTHKNVHTKLKPYVCGIQGCKSAFGDPSSCARHRKETHRNVGAYQCPHPRCKSSIKRRSAFTAHLRKHNIDPDTVDIEAMAPLLRRSSMRSIRGIAQAKIDSQRLPSFDFGLLDDMYPISFNASNTPYVYQTSHSNVPPFAGNDTNINNNRFSFQYHTVNPFEMSSINNGELFAIDSSPSPPQMSSVFTMSPSPISSPDYIQTPRGSPRLHHPHVKVASPAISPILQPSLLFFSEPVYAAGHMQKGTWKLDTSIFGTLDEC